MAAFHRLKFVVAASCALNACSTSTNVPDQQTSVAQENFSPEDKRIAGALSIGGHDIQKSATPQHKATLCSLALAAIEDRMQNGGTLSAEQQQAFAQAQSIFQRRSGAGLTPDEREQTRADVEAAYPELSDRVRFAVGCLRELV